MKIIKIKKIDVEKQRVEIKVEYKRSCIIIIGIIK